MTQATLRGRPTGGKPINLAQLEDELHAAGVNTSGLGADAAYIFVYDGVGAPVDFPTADELKVDQAIAAHVARRDKSDAEYAIEFQNPATTAERKQEIRDIQAGLLSREQLPL
jgi:hypothetical protein